MTTRILILGSSGMLGSAVQSEIVHEHLGETIHHNSTICDLRNQSETNYLIHYVKPEVVYNCAGVVGGIKHNMSNQYVFGYDNTLIGLNIIDSLLRHNVKYFYNVASSCMYPRDCKQPMKEEYLFKGELEPTNRSYALAKLTIANLVNEARTKFDMRYISFVPCNLYGYGDDFNTFSGHVMASLIAKFMNEDENVIVMGDGTARRELMHVTDAAKIIVKASLVLSDPIINVGTGTDISIAELAQIIKKATNSMAKIIFDKSAAAGMPQKLLDISKIMKLNIPLKYDIQRGVEFMVQEFKRQNIWK